MTRRNGGRAALAALGLAAVFAGTALAQDPVLVEDSPLDEVDAGTSGSAPATAPPASATLRYYLHQTVSSGTGEYAGWGDSLVSVGDYRTEGGVVHGSYAWRYASPDRADSGMVIREVAFDPSTRDYTTSQTDLDDYDGTPGPLATWLWIPTTLDTGAQVRILDTRFDVMGRRTVACAGTERDAILVHADGTGERHDEYGDFSTSFSDDYWFDAATGMFLREERTESDTGTYEGSRAGFHMSLVVEVVDASYAPSVGALPPEPVPHYRSQLSSSDEGDGGSTLLPFLCFGVVALVIAFFAMLGRRNAYRNQPFVARSLSVGEPPPPGIEALSPHLGPFLPQMVEVARRSGNGVAVATARATGALAGLAVDDGDARMVALYASDPDCAEALRRERGRLELISEVRYPPLPSVRQALAATGRSDTQTFAYNLYETFEIMERRGAIEPLDYDPSVVVRMQPGDVAEAAALAQRVYLVPCEAFLRASLEAGDVAFVAKQDGKIVGMALATLAGSAARLHTLMVDPDVRSRGLGKELYRARLRALADLGVDHVITEVASNNPAAMQIARAHGMQKVGEMHVQSARATREPIGVVRR